jgi:hypothetical protein
VAVPLAPESKLILAIFRQAALDLRSGNPRLVRDARAWVLEKGSTFDRYARLLGLDPAAMRSAMMNGSSRRIGPMRARKDPQRSKVGPDWDKDAESA